MKRRATCMETTQEWKAILSTLPSLSSPPGIQSEDDPFRCEDVIFPSTFEVVAQTVEDYQRKWQQLDDRKIVTDSGKASEDRPVELGDQEQQEKDESKKKRAWGGWRFVEDRLRLPHCFDYKGMGSEPDDSGSGERVLTLSSLAAHEENPETTSYEKELWKMFKSIPSSNELEEIARVGAQLPCSIDLQQRMFATMSKHSPPDRYLLARLRTADRHGLPPGQLPRNMDGSIPAPSVSTLRFECWRKQPRRLPSPDPNRMVIEFTTDQTLLDFHLALVQMQEDVLWEDASGIKETPSGCFFLEGEFYIHGDVDYATPLIEWIDGGNDEPNPVRRGYLGMSSMEPISRKPMKDAHLKDLPLRLGFRYYHACHGDVETNVFLIDRRLTWTSPIRYPILHDIWTPYNRVPFCDACGTFNAAYVTSSALVETDEARRSLCEPCRVLLQIPKDQLDLYAAYRDETAMSSSFLPKSKRNPY